MTTGNIIAIGLTLGALLAALFLYDRTAPESKIIIEIRSEGAAEVLPPEQNAGGAFAD